MKKTFLVLGLAILFSTVIIALAITIEEIKDPVCGMTVDPENAAAVCEGENGNIYFCSEACKDKFCADPTAFISQEKLDHLGVCIDSTKADCTECKTCPGGDMEKVKDEAKPDVLPEESGSSTGDDEAKPDVLPEESGSSTGDDEAKSQPE